MLLTATHFLFMALKGEPVEVTVEIKVVSFGELNEANMVWLCYGLFLLSCKIVFFSSFKARHHYFRYEIDQ